MQPSEQIAAKAAPEEGTGYGAIDAAIERGDIRLKDVRALITKGIEADRAQRAQATEQTPEQIAEQISDGVVWRHDDTAEVSAQQIEALLIEAARAGIQTAWESWEPDEYAEASADHPSNGGVTLWAEIIETHEGVTFTPMSTDGGIGYEVTAPDGATEFVFLSPSHGHDINPDNGAIADTFMYVVAPVRAVGWAAEQEGSGTGASLTDFAEDVAYVNHFEGCATEEDNRQQC